MPDHTPTPPHQPMVDANNERQRQGDELIRLREALADRDATIARQAEVLESYRRMSRHDKPLRYREPVEPPDFMAESIAAEEALEGYRKLCRRLAGSMVFSGKRGAIAFDDEARSALPAHEIAELRRRGVEVGE